MANYNDPGFRQSMKLQMNFNNMMAQYVGAKGITEEESAANQESVLSDLDAFFS